MNSNFCRYLRTKKLYTDATPAEAFAEKATPELTPCHFWCNRTQTVAGPDDGPVHKDTCQAGRACYEG